MAVFTVEVKGLAELERTLNQIPDDLAKRSLKEATKAGGEVFRQEMRSRIHNVSGKLFRSIQNTVRQTGPGEITATVGPKGRWAQAVALWLEKGTKAHDVRIKDKKTLARGGVMYGAVIHHPGAKPKEFIIAGFDAGKDDALKVFVEELVTFFARLGK